MIKEIIKGESIRTCDVCGNKIDYEKDISSSSNISILLQESVWNFHGFKSYDICKKHSKQIKRFLKELKKEAGE